MGKKLAEHVDNLIRVLHFINTAAPDDPSQTGTPLHISQIAEELNLSTGDVSSCIEKLNIECGELMPEMFIEFDDETGMVTPRRIVGLTTKPLRLTSFEAHGLLNALMIAGYTQGELIDSIAGALPVLDADRLQTMVRHAGNVLVRQNLLVITAAMRHQKAVRISYHKPATPVSSDRIVEPYDIFFDSTGGSWLMTAWCRSAHGWRRFRLDRIDSCEETNEPIEHSHGFVKTLQQTALLIVHDPAAVTEAYDWQILQRVKYPRRYEQSLLSEEDTARGGYIAYAPWYVGSRWLPQMIIRTGGRIEAVAPKDLRDLVRDLAQAIINGGSLH